MKPYANQRLVLVTLLATMLASCGDDGSAVQSPAVAPSSSITYRLTPTLNPSSDKNGSRIALKVPPVGSTGIVGDFGLIGTFDVVPVTPTSPDLVLDYRITRVDLESADRSGQPFGGPAVVAQGDDVGRIQIRAGDGILSMRLRAVELAFEIEYELMGAAGPDRYSLVDGQLVLRGVKIQTPEGDPYYGFPNLTFFAAPEN